MLRHVVHALPRCMCVHMSVSVCPCVCVFGLLLLWEQQTSIVNSEEAIGSCWGLEFFKRETHTNFNCKKRLLLNYFKCGPLSRLSCVSRAVQPLGTTSLWQGYVARSVECGVWTGGPWGWASWHVIKNTLNEFLRARLSKLLSTFQTGNCSCS